MRITARLLFCLVLPLLSPGCESGTVAGTFHRPVPCSLVLPRGINLGLVPAGVRFRSSVPIENLRSDEACRIVDARLEACDAGFQFDLGPFDAPAGATTELPFTLEAGAGTVSCTLVLETEHDQRTVPIRATVDPACFPIPAEFDLGPMMAGCPFTRFLDLPYGCDVGLTIESVEVASGPFSVAPPPLPLTLARGDVFGLGVRFEPEGLGPAEGLLHLRFAGVATPHPMRLRGEGTDGGPEDVFHQAPRPKIDFLFVIENGTSMAGALEHVAHQLRHVEDYAQAQELDFHLGVTTTGLEPGGECPGGVGGGEDGRLVPVDGSRPRWFALDSPQPWAADWEANLAVGACRTGPSRPLEAALRALSPPLADHADDPRHPEPSDGNVGFLRPDADLELIVVTDRPDESPGSVASYLEAFRTWKAGRQVDVSAFTGDPQVGCTGDGGISAGPGDRLAEAVRGTDEGVFQSFCAPDWESSLREATAMAFGYQTCFNLSAVPLDSDGDGVVSEADFVVRVNGRVVTPIGPGGQRSWSFHEGLRAICFHPLAVPEPSSEIRVAYENECA